MRGAECKIPSSGCRVSGFSLETSHSALQNSKLLSTFLTFLPPRNRQLRLGVGIAIGIGIGEKLGVRSLGYELKCVMCDLRSSVRKSNISHLRSCFSLPIPTPPSSPPLGAGPERPVLPVADGTSAQGEGPVEDGDGVLGQECRKTQRVPKVRLPSRGSGSISSKRGTTTITLTIARTFQFQLPQVSSLHDSPKAIARLTRRPALFHQANVTIENFPVTGKWRVGGRCWTRTSDLRRVKTAL